MTDTTTLRDRLDVMVRRLNDGDLDGYLAGYAPTVVPHGYPEGVTDADSLRGCYTQLFGALGDARVEVEQAVEQGGVVAARFVLRGQHRGALLGVAPTGRQLELRGATFLRFEDGLVAERWQHADDLGVLQQLGLVPTA